MKLESDSSTVASSSSVFRIEDDGFEGTVIGTYTTREGKRGLVLQQIGTKVIHTYGLKCLLMSEYSA